MEVIFGSKILEIANGVGVVTAVYRCRSSYSGYIVLSWRIRQRMDRYEETCDTALRVGMML